MISRLVGLKEPIIQQCSAEFGRSIHSFFIFYIITTSTSHIVTPEFRKKTMPFSNINLFTFLLTILSQATSAPTSIPTNTSLPAPASHAAACFTSQVTLVTVEKPFSLQALSDNAVQKNWPVQIKPPSDTTATELYISNSRTALPTFTLQNGRLTTQGVDGKSFAAYLGFTISIFPPVLQQIFFGNGNPDFSDWWAAYTCDAAGQQYLELRHGRGKFKRH